LKLLIGYNRTGYFPVCRCLHSKKTLFHFQNVQFRQHLSTSYQRNRSLCRIVTKRRATDVTEVIQSAYLLATSFVSLATQPVASAKRTALQPLNLLEDFPWFFLSTHFNLHCDSFDSNTTRCSIVIPLESQVKLRSGARRLLYRIRLLLKTIV